MIKEEIVKFKLRYARGQSWISYFNPVIFLFGAVNFDFLKEHVIIIGIVYVTGCWIIGYIDQGKYGTWLYESEFTTKNLNPAMLEIYNNVKR